MITLTFVCDCGTSGTCTTASLESDALEAWIDRMQEHTTNCRHAIELSATIPVSPEVEAERRRRDVGK